MHSRSVYCDQQESAEVLPFRTRAVLRPAVNRMGMRERITAAAWEDAARTRGIARTVFHAGHDDEDPADGDFILVYEVGADWASWGVAPQAEGFAAWRTGTGTTIGCFPSLIEALNALQRVD